MFVGGRVACIACVSLARVRLVSVFVAIHYQHSHCWGPTTREDDTTALHLLLTAAVWIHRPTGIELGLYTQRRVSKHLTSFVRSVVMPLLQVKIRNLLWDAHRPKIMVIGHQPRPSITMLNSTTINMNMRTVADFWLSSIADLPLMWRVSSWKFLNVVSEALSTLETIVVGYII